MKEKEIRLIIQNIPVKDRVDVGDISNRGITIDMIKSFKNTTKQITPDDPAKSERSKAWREFINNMNA
ncbi:MAG: hypothetical protein Q8P29_00160 [Candidatus Levybacteria bacterium]|nr:hypothetical protein [Candidatus Levybacteria bacterium]MDZ4227984.1 hypothetical protein [Candidatus Levybacteria bacterium]